MKSKGMIISDLKIGMRLDGNFREYDWCNHLSVEFVAYDWAVARDERGRPHFLTNDSSNMESLHGRT